MDKGHALVERAQSHPEAIKRFDAFYRLVHDNPSPVHSLAWLVKLFKAKEKDMGAVIRAFRGSTKSTTFNTFAAWITGENPAGCSLIIRGTDVAAKESAEQVADIISMNEGFRAVYPYVVPDTDKGWSQHGYEVKLIHEDGEDVDYLAWRRRNSDRRDPSVVALPYTSETVLGMHPSNFLGCDDLHNDDNTTSDRLFRQVVRRLTGTIFPTRRPHNPLTVFVGTPWLTDDVLARVLDTGEYIGIVTPVYTPTDEPVNGTDVVQFEWETEPVKLTWPEWMGEGQIIKEYNQDITPNKAEFARMMLCDLTRTERGVFRFQNFPYIDIDVKWPANGGCDYASVPDPTKRDPHRSHYALAYLLKNPATNTLIVYDGILEQCTQEVGEQHIRTAQNSFPSWGMTVIESDGKGEEFIYTLQRQPGLRLDPRKTGGKRKADRLVLGLGPWLANGRVLVSDADTPFLNAFRRFLNLYPNVTRSDPGWDAADSVYWAMHAFPECLVMEYRGDSLKADYSNLANLMKLPGYERVTMLPEAFIPDHMREKRHQNPYMSFGDEYGKG